MHRAQLQHQESSDEHRRPAPDYQAGDLVWLDARNWKTQRPSAKLDHRHYRPFRIAREITSHAYQLELHNSMQVHPVFHVSLLEPAAEDPPPFPDNDNQRHLQWRSMANRNSLWTAFSTPECTGDDYSTSSNPTGNRQKMSTNSKPSPCSTNNTQTSPGP